MTGAPCSTHCDGARRGGRTLAAVCGRRLLSVVLLVCAASCRCSPARLLRRGDPDPAQTAQAVQGENPDDPHASPIADIPVTVAPDAGASLGGCPMFPADNPWNRDVSGDPVDPRSDRYIANIQAHGDPNLHPDFGANPEYGIPYVVVPASQPRVPIRFTEYGDESDPGPYPVPLDAPIERGRDHHVLVLQQGTCKLFELYHAARDGAGWRAGSGATFDLRSNRLRPREWTSCDQAGLPILPGLVRYDEVMAGEIRHALRVTFEHTQSAWVAPATHPGGDDDPDAPPMGLRIRLKASFNTARLHGQARVIARAMQRYGMFVADTGGNWFVSGSTDRRWRDDDLEQLKEIPGTAFEVVASGPLQRLRSR